MSRTLRIVERARADTDDIFTWIANRSVQGAISWYLAFHQAVDRIAETPELFAEAPEAPALVQFTCDCERSDSMSTVLLKGIIRSGRVEVAEPINLPDGSEVTITGHTCGTFIDLVDNNRPMTPSEIAATLAAMDQIKPFDLNDEERAAADAWEKKVNDYTISNMDKGIEDVFR